MSRTQRRIRLDHVEVIYLHRDDGELITKPLDKHAKEQRNVSNNLVGLYWIPESNRLLQAEQGQVTRTEAFPGRTGPGSIQTLRHREMQFPIHQRGRKTEARL